jgi:hypothetical protein
MFIKLLKAIAELVYVSVRLGYDYMFYPSSKTVERAKKIIDPEYDGDEYGSGETVATLKDEWIQGNMNEVEESEWRQKYMSDVYDFSEVDDYSSDPMVVEPTKKILKES